MPAETLQSKELIQRAVEHLTKIAPVVKDVQVQIRKTSHGLFEATIKVFTKRKKIIAQKQDFSFSKSLQRAINAIEKQLQKMGGLKKWQVTKHIQLS